MPASRRKGGNAGHVWAQIFLLRFKFSAGLSFGAQHSASSTNPGLFMPGQGKMDPWSLDPDDAQSFAEVSGKRKEMGKRPGAIRDLPRYVGMREMER